MCVSAGIKIVEPLEGQVFHSGEKVTVTAEATEGTNISSVLFVAPDWLSSVDSAPFAATFTVPEKIIGTVKIVAGGVVVPNKIPSVTTDVSIKVKPKAILQSLHTQFPDFYLKQGMEYPISVYGKYSDGVIRSPRGKDQGTTYVSANENIATVDENGKMYPQGLGTTNITVSNSGVTLIVSVTVSGEWLPPPEETVPPTVTLAQNPPVNEKGWYNTDLEIILNAEDNEGGSGIKEIIYVLGGGKTPAKRHVTEKNSVNFVVSDEGKKIMSYWTIDNEKNTSDGAYHRFTIDKTPPSISAEWIPVVREGEKDDDDDEEEREYTVRFSVTDNLDKSPSVIAVIETPEMVDPKVKLEKEEDKIKYVFELENNKVKIVAGNPAEVWAEVQELGGIAVSNGQIIKTEYEEDEFTAKLKNGKLKIEAPEIILRVTATDAAGNQERYQPLLSQHGSACPRRRSK